MEKGISIHILDNNSSGYFWYIYPMKMLLTKFEQHILQLNLFVDTEKEK